MMTHMFRTTLMLLTVSLLAACSGKTEQPETNPIPEGMKEGPGVFSGESGNILDAFRGGNGGNMGTGGGIGVNSYLWRASLESVSFMPIVQADSSGGVIITDWYTNPDQTSERYKLNVYILGTSLRPENLNVKVFRQVKKGGAWSDMSAGAATARELEDTILTKARVLRVKDKASN